MSAFQRSTHKGNPYQVAANMDNLTIEVWMVTRLCVTIGVTCWLIKEHFLRFHFTFSQIRVE